MKYINYFLLIVIVLLLFYIYNNSNDRVVLPTGKAVKALKTTIIKGQKLGDSVLNISRLIDLKKQQDEGEIDSLCIDIKWIKTILSD